MKRRLPVLSLCIAVILAVSCGDDEQGPSGPGSNPDASTLSAASGATNAITLWWTSCGSSDFAEYRLYRSLSTGIQSNPDQATIIQIVTSAADTTLSDAGLDWSTTYYYAIQTLDTENLSAWSNETSAATPDSGSSGGDALTCYEVQGQQSSSPYAGQTVSVTGIVTAGEGEFSGTYAAMADADGGPWSGLILYGNDVTGISRGDSITITGLVEEFNGLTELKFPTSIVVHSSGHSLPGAQDVTTDEVYQPTTAEQWESVLIRVNDVIVTETPDQYGQWKVDDGSGEAIVDDMGNYSYNPLAGDTLDSVTGVLNYSFDEFKIEPRDDADIQGGSGGTVLTCYEVQGQQASSPYDGQTVSVTGIVTVGAGEYDYTYAAMADAGGGPWSGLILYGNDVTGISRGDSITITGPIDEYYGLTELKYPTSIVVHSTGHPLPAAEAVTTGDVSVESTAEQWESVLVMVEDVDVITEPDQYGEWNIDDGSGQAMVGDLGAYTYTPVAGNQIASLTGVLNYSFSCYKLEPRDDADIVE